MATAGKPARSRKGTTGGKKRRLSGWRRVVDRGRKVLPGLLLVCGIALGIGIGYGIATLPPAPVALPAAMDVPPAKPPEKKSAEKAAEKETVVPDDVEVQQPSSAPGSSAAKTVLLPVSTPTQTPAGMPVAVPAAQVAALPQSGAILPPPQIPADGLPLWRQNAASYKDPGDRPMIAIVLDDVGVAPQHALAALDLPAPIVLSIMTYADKAATLSREARQRGHEVMVHMPMQPLSTSIDPGPHALMVGLADDEIRRRVEWGLSRFTGYVGFNNHMGSRFTQDQAGMRTVLEMARERGLLFLDSKTIAGSVGDALAGEMGVTHIARDVFLDDNLNEEAIARQLTALEAVARKHGYAVAIGHPHPATIAVLKRWLPGVQKRGIAIVPLTTIVKKRDGVAG